jgi:hypothetical protein
MRAIESSLKTEKHPVAFVVMCHSGLTPVAEYGDQVNGFITRNPEFLLSLFLFRCVSH